MGALESYPRITPFLWFNADAEEAVDFYISIFKSSRRLDNLRADGRVITIGFELDGQKFTALNGGPSFKFNEAISLVVRCDTQEEIDHYWTALSAGGSEGQCGWLKDKFGLSWQIVPARMADLLRAPGAMQAMMQMKKLDVAKLEAAAHE